MEIEIVVTTDHPCAAELIRTKEKAFDLVNHLKEIIVYGEGLPDGTRLVLEELSDKPTN